VGTPTLIGVPAPGGAYTARHLHHGEQPHILVPLLRRIWTGTFARDTAALAAVLLARDWSGLAVNSRRRGGDRRRPVPGVGHPAPSGDGDARHGRLGEDLDGFLEWLYLLFPERRVVVVYEATCHARWLRHSLHYLDPVEEVFVAEPDPDGGPEPAMTVRTVCGAVDEIEYHELPSMVGYGEDTSTACQRCGSSLTTDPMLGAHVTRKPWPPHPVGTPGRPDLYPDAATTAWTTTPSREGTD
jgi:hypothetical protein